MERQTITSTKQMVFQLIKTDFSMLWVQTSENKLGQIHTKVVKLTSGSVTMAAITTQQMVGTRLVTCSNRQV